MSTYKVSTTDGERDLCKCCGGDGTQERQDGIRIKCPCCNGTGYRIAGIEIW